MTDRIEKRITLAAPVERVWRAVTDHVEFGQWFGVRLDAPFAADEVSHGQITRPGFEHVRWAATVTAIDPSHRFAFTWHPYAIDLAVDYSGETPTLVEFLLAAVPDGTELTITESGFDALPVQRRTDALRMNDRGWAAQLDNIAAHVAA